MLLRMALFFLNYPVRISQKSCRATLTPQLGTLSQSILILLMFFGRVGGLTLIYAAFSGHDMTYARYPKEMITVG